jgi:hypothetical protein
VEQQRGDVAVEPQLEERRSTMALAAKERRLEDAMFAEQTIRAEQRCTPRARAGYKRQLRQRETCSGPALHSRVQGWRGGCFGAPVGWPLGARSGANLCFYGLHLGIDRHQDDLRRQKESTQAVKASLDGQVRR